MPSHDTPGPRVAIAVLDSRLAHAEHGLAALAEEVDEKHMRIRSDLADGLASRATVATVTALSATLAETRDLALRIWYIALGMATVATVGGVGYLVRLLLTGRT